MVRLGSPKIRAGLPLLKDPPRVPDPGQHVDLWTEDGSWRRGFRAITEPTTSERGEVVVWVATEDEYRAAQRQGRSAVGMPWPTQRMAVASSEQPWRLPQPEPPRSPEVARRPRWGWKLSSYLDAIRSTVGLRILLAITVLVGAVALYCLLTASGVLGGD